jgi:arginine decarboxylase-like protein
MDDGDKMNKSEIEQLAYEVNMWGEDLLALNMKGGVPVTQAAKVLIQQQAEIEELLQFIVERGETGQLIMWKAQQK